LIISVRGLFSASVSNCGAFASSELQSKTLPRAAHRGSRSW